MDYQEAIRELESLKIHCFGMINRKDKDSVWIKDCEALCVAIAAIQELKKYRSIGTLKEVREAVEKQRSKKPIFNEIRFRNRGRIIGECTTLEDAYNCPSCNLTLWKSDFPEYCHHCGQSIDWSGEYD